MGYCVLHSDFQAQDMDNMDLVLGSPWMKLVGTINLNIDKKFLKIWYKKKKVTLQDISLATQEEPNGAPTKTSTGNLVGIPLDTSDDESMVVDTTDIPKDGHYNEKESKLEAMPRDVSPTIEEAPIKPQVVEV